MRAANGRSMTSEMGPSVSILLFDHDTLFREAVRNFLLAAGYPHVDVAPSAPEALVKLHSERYRHVLIGLSRPLSEGQELAAEAQRLQPDAKIFPLIHAEDQPFLHNDAFEYLIKESIFANLLEVLEEKGGGP